MRAFPTPTNMAASGRQFSCSLGIQGCIYDVLELLVEQIIPCLGLQVLCFFSDNLRNGTSKAKYSAETNF